MPEPCARVAAPRQKFAFQLRTRVIRAAPRHKNARRLRFPYPTKRHWRFKTFSGECASLSRGRRGRAGNTGGYKDDAASSRRSRLRGLLAAALIATALSPAFAVKRGGDDQACGIQATEETSAEAIKMEPPTRKQSIASPPRSPL